MRHLLNQMLLRLEPDNKARRLHHHHQVETT